QPPLRQGRLLHRQRGRQRRLQGRHGLAEGDGAGPAAGGADQRGPQRQQPRAHGPLPDQRRLRPRPHQRPAELLLAGDRQRRHRGQRLDLQPPEAQVTAQTAVTPPANLPDVAQQITHLDENFRNFITSAYQKYLGRLPDQAGLDAWALAMETQGLSYERLEAGFIGSDEYIALHGGKGAGWVQGMYHDLLGRAP